jgi:hypothetical protein
MRRPAGCPTPCAVSSRPQARRSASSGLGRARPTSALASPSTSTGPARAPHAVRLPIPAFVFSDGVRDVRDWLPHFEVVIWYRKRHVPPKNEGTQHRPGDVRAQACRLVFRAARCTARVGAPGRTLTPPPSHSAGALAFLGERLVKARFARLFSLFSSIYVHEIQVV